MFGNPFDVMKTKMMTSQDKTQKSLPAMMKLMMKEAGVKGFYRGIEANILRFYSTLLYLSYVFIYLPTLL